MEKVDLLLAEKEAAVKRAVERGAPADDLKAAAGEIYNAAKRQLQLVGCGSDTKSFMRVTLAPLVRPGTKVYEDLKRDIFG